MNKIDRLQNHKGGRCGWKTVKLGAEVFRDTERGQAFEVSGNVQPVEGSF